MVQMALKRAEWRCGRPASRPGCESPPLCWAWGRLLRWTMGCREATVAAGTLGLLGRRLRLDEGEVSHIGALGGHLRTGRAELTQ